MITLKHLHFKLTRQDSSKENVYFYFDGTSLQPKGRIVIYIPFGWRNRSTSLRLYHHKLTLMYSLKYIIELPVSKSIFKLEYFNNCGDRSLQLMEIKTFHFKDSSTHRSFIAAGCSLVYNFFVHIYYPDTDTKVEYCYCSLFCTCF